MTTLLLVLILAQPVGRPLFYWGARPASIVTEVAPGNGLAAQVTEVHGVVDDGELILRVSFDRPVSDALYLPSGAPVSGRLRVALYVDGDAIRTTGWAAEPGDPRGGEDSLLPAYHLESLRAVGGRGYQAPGDETGRPGNGENAQ